MGAANAAAVNLGLVAQSALQTRETTTRSPHFRRVMPETKGVPLEKIQRELGIE